ncbi:MAG: hypothetical protein EB165_05635 [Euryarchaeota archaeon]|nr:hypothetical protein [Euryarchaeota archaeon]
MKMQFGITLNTKGKFGPKADFTSSRKPANFGTILSMHQSSTRRKTLPSARLTKENQNEQTI